LKTYLKLFVATLFLIVSLDSAIAYDLSEYPSPFLKDGKFNGVFVVGDQAPAEDIITTSQLIVTFQYPVLGSEPDSVSAIDNILENHTKTYTINGLDYEITLKFIDSRLAQFSVNGMASPILSIGDGFDLPDGKRITLADLFFDNGKHSATFFFGIKKIKIEKTTVESGSAMLASEVENINSMNSIIVGNACDNELVLKVRGTQDDCKSGYEQGVGRIESYEFPNGKVSIIITGYSANDTYNAAQVLRFYGYYMDSLKGNKIEVINENGKLVVRPGAQEKSSSVGNANLQMPNNSLSENNFKMLIFVFAFLITALTVLIYFEHKENKKR